MDHDEFFKDFEENRRRNDLFFNIFLGVFCVIFVLVVIFIIYALYRTFILKKPFYSSK